MKFRQLKLSFLHMSLTESLWVVSQECFYPFFSIPPIQKRRESVGFKTVLLHLKASLSFIMPCA